MASACWPPARAAWRFWTACISTWRTTTGFAAACRQGAELGFDGKTLIHPKQIGPANEAFAPDAETLARARRIIAAHEQAAREGQGVVVVDGRLVEHLHVVEARRQVHLAEAIAAMPR